MTCEDCGAAGTLSIFDGARMVDTCDNCHFTRACGPVPSFQLTPSPDSTMVIGHAAPVNVEFERRVSPSRERVCFLRGAFAEITGPVYLGVNHEICQCDGCFSDGKPARSPLAELIRPERAIASTTHGTLTLAEDLYGLLFIAQIWNDKAVQYPGEDRVVIVDAIRNGSCSELSVHFHGGTALHPAPLKAYGQCNLVELSLLIRSHHFTPDGRGDAPGTWVQVADDSAMRTLYGHLRAMYLTDAHAASTH